MTSGTAIPSPKPLMLGTAQWGWSVNQQQAFELLDAWLQAGQQHIDAATNYPINQVSTDFRASERILMEYTKAHGLQGQLKTTMKIGSVDNMRTPDHNLSPSFLQMMADEYRRVLGKNIGGLMVHWDNRSNPEEINSTVELMAAWSSNGLRPGLSGIRHPEVYEQVMSNYEFDFDLELKHNVFASDLARYADFLKASQARARTWAYGTQAGGIKLGDSQQTAGTFALRGGQYEPWKDRLAQIERKLPQFNTAFVRPPLITMHQLGMAYALSNPAIHGIVVAPRTPAQLRETLEWHENLAIFDYSDLKTI